MVEHTLGNPSPLAPGWDPLDTQDEYDVELVLAETVTQQKVRRNRIQVFNRWAHRNGITGPQDVDWDAWTHFLVWLEMEVGYAASYRKHVIMETREWLEWAHSRGYRGPVDVGVPIPQGPLETLCRAHMAGQFTGPEGNPFQHHLRETMLGLVFGEGVSPDRLHELLISDYDLRSHTLAGEPLDPRAEKLVQRYLGHRVRRKGGATELFVDFMGAPLGPRSARFLLNRLLRRYQAIPRDQTRWMPTPERDRDLVLNILTSRPRPVGPEGAKAKAIDAGPILRHTAPGEFPPGWGGGESKW